MCGRVTMYEQIHMSEKDMLKAHDFMRRNPTADWNEIQKFLEDNCSPYSRDQIKICGEPSQVYLPHPNHEGFFNFYDGEGEEVMLDKTSPN